MCHVGFTLWVQLLFYIAMKVLHIPCCIGKALSSWVEFRTSVWAVHMFLSWLVTFLVIFVVVVGNKLLLRQYILSLLFLSPFLFFPFFQTFLQLSIVRKSMAPWITYCKLCPCRKKVSRSTQRWKIGWRINLEQVLQGLKWVVNVQTPVPQQNGWAVHKVFLPTIVADREKISLEILLIGNVRVVHVKQEGGKSQWCSSGFKFFIWHCN